jgi:hypothetical protein
MHLTTPSPQSPTGPETELAAHKFLFDPNDIARMHGNFGILAEMGGVQGVAYTLRTDCTTGLYEDEMSSYQNGQFSLRREVWGENVFPRPPMKSFLEHCWDGLQDPILILLMVSTCI